MPWVLPWSVLPEVDYLLAARLGPDVERLFLRDLASSAFLIDWGSPSDLSRAYELNQLYADLNLRFPISRAYTLEADFLTDVGSYNRFGLSLKGYLKGF